MSIVNLAAYQFATLEATAEWRPLVTERCNALGLRGTILLAPEGINLFVAGTPEAAHGFMDYIRHDPLFEGKFANLQFKESLSGKQPFRRMLVKLKREIITMKKPAIRPELGRAPSVDAPTLKAWLDRGHDDEGRPVVMLDTRNAFEVDVGTFDDALDYRTALDPELKPTATAQCFGCRAVVSPEAQQSPLYVPGKTCPECHPERNAARAA